MATRQYIGARYVPKFFSGVNGSSEWVSGIQYEALTIVTRLGNGFTSRKPVPSSVGAPEDNPEYWVNTFNFNSQVELLSEEINALENRLDEVNDRYYIFIGDSYSVGGQGWIKHLVDCMGLSESEYCNAGLSGTAFVAPTTNHGFIDCLNSAVVPDAEKVTDIIVCGGYNETFAATVTTLGNAIVAFCTRAKELYPNATVRVGFIGNNANLTTDGNNARSALRDFLEVYRNVSSYGTNAVYLNGVETSCLDYALFQADGIHPTDLGNLYIAESIKNAILTGDGSFIRLTKTLTLSGIPYGSQVGEIRTRLDNGICSFDFAPFMEDFTQGITISAGQQEFGTLGNCNYYREFAKRTLAIPVLMYYRTTAMVTTTEMAIIMIQNGKVYLTALTEHTNINRLYFYANADYKIW